MADETSVDYRFSELSLQPWARNHGFSLPKSNQKYLKFGNEDEIGKTMSPAKAQRRQGSENSKNLFNLEPWRDKFSLSRSVRHFRGKYL